MEINQLKYFLAAAQTQNFRRAADLCAVAQSVLSRQIAALEAELGLQLFYRVEKKVVLSEAGSEFAKYARNALAQLQQGQQSLVELKTGERGIIAVGCVEALATTYFPVIFSHFHAKYPNIRLHITVAGADDLMEQIEQGKLDFGLIFHPITRPELLVVRELFRQPLHLITPLTHSFVQNKIESVTLAQAAAEPLVILREGFGLRRIMEALFERHGFPLEFVAEIDSVEGLKELVKQQIGVTLMPKALIRRAQINIELATIPLRDYNEEFVFALVHRRFGIVSMAARALMNYILETDFSGEIDRGM